MKYVEIPLPELLGIAATRVILGAGLGLLLGDQVEPSQRRMLGIILTTIGVLSTGPFAYDVLNRRLHAQ